MCSARIRGKTRIIYLLVGFHCLLVQPGSFAQTINYTVKRYTTEHGLPNNHVKYITKDNDGFLWIATFDGLSRFDGYEFRNYYHDPNDSTSIPTFDLLKVLVDKNNHVWVFGPNALCRFERSDESFQRYSGHGKDRVGSKTIFDICLDRDSTLWIVGDAGFDMYNEVTGQFIHFTHPTTERLPSKIPGCDLVFDNRNRFWLIGVSDLVYYGHIDSVSSQKSYIIEDIFRKPTITSMVNLDFQPNLMEDASRGMWITSNDGLFRFDKQRSTFIKANEKELPGRELFRQPVIWSEIGKGMYIYYPDTDTVFNIYNPLLQIGRGRFADQDIFWFGGMAGSTEGIGLIEVLMTHGQFKHVIIPGDETDTKTAIFGLIKDLNGVLWAGVRGKPYLLRIFPEGEIYLCNYSTEKYLKNGNHLRTLEMVNGKIWAGYLFNYCYWYDPNDRPENLRIVNPDHILSLGSLVDQSSFRVILQDNQQNVVIGGKKTLIYYDPKGDKILSTFPSTGALYSIYQDYDSVIWIGATDTLYRFDKGLTNGQRIAITHSRYNIESIVERDTGTLWLAMMGGGLVQFDKKTRKFKVFGTKDGLSNNFIYNILKGSQGNLWISTNKGISMFNPKTSRFRNFGKEDGLSIEEFNADAAYKTSEGEMIFGGMGGIVTFHPDSVFAADPFDISMPLLITGLNAVGDTLVNIYDIYEREQVTLPKGTKHMALSFACIDFRNAEKIQYRYRMTGISNNWIISDSRHRYIRFTGLKPGNYTFELQATDINGNWTNKKSLRIQIPAYFYQTNWFQLLMISVIIITVVVLFLTWRRQTLLNEQRKTVQLRLDSLRNQLNPHFLFNSLNSINYFISNHDQISANSFITGFSRLMRAILTNSSAEYISMEKEMEALEDYCKLEHLRFGDKFDYRIIVDEKIIPAETEITPTMAQPFIENAIWHGVRGLEGRKGLVEIAYQPGSEDHIICTIKDDGIGRKSSAERKSEEQRKRRSRGIAIIRERLEMINTIRKLSLSITVEDLYPEKEEAGTEVIIEIPIKRI